MAWERMGLVRPARESGRRVYSGAELRWLECLQSFNRDGGVSLSGLATMLKFVPCWGIRAQLAARDGVGESCAPTEWPASRCFERVVKAYEGEAVAECRDCEIYRERSTVRAASRPSRGE